jgi:hypothetical protein
MNTITTAAVSHFLSPSLPLFSSIRYNISHPFATDVVNRELSLGFDGIPHSSFDVRFCEVAVHELGYVAPPPFSNSD